MGIRTIGAILIAGFLHAAVASADQLQLIWPDVTATWTGTINRVYYDDDGSGHLLFNADGEPVWTGTVVDMFATGFDDIHWSALIRLPPGQYWETVSGTCTYSVDGTGTNYKLTCQ